MQTSSLILIRRAHLALVGLVTCTASAHAQQFVVTEATYTADAQNTTDSHYRVNPLPGTPANWRSPIDYASGTAHARLEVLEKPSSQKTLYNICYEATPSYACMGYSPAYTAPGVYDFSFAFSTFYQYSSVDWSQGVKDIALILKDESGNKKQGDPAFYPTKIHITITIVAPGATYVPPTFGKDAGTDAATPVDAGASSGNAGSGSAGSAGPKDAGKLAPAADAAVPTRPSDAGGSAQGSAGTSAHAIDAGTTAPGLHRDAGSSPSSSSDAGSQVASTGAAPQATAGARSSDEVSGGCSIVDLRPDAMLGLLWLGTLLIVARRGRQRAPESR